MYQNWFTDIIIVIYGLYKLSSIFMLQTRILELLISVSVLCMCEWKCFTDLYFLKFLRLFCSCFNFIKLRSIFQVHVIYINIYVNILWNYFMDILHTKKMFAFFLPLCYWVSCGFFIFFTVKCKWISVYIMFSFNEFIVNYVIYN